jgi:hypothetical protein
VGDWAVATLVNPGVVADVDEEEPEVADVGNAGTGGRVERCNLGAPTPLKELCVCAACDGRGYVVAPAFEILELPSVISTSSDLADVTSFISGGEDFGEIRGEVCDPWLTWSSNNFRNKRWVGVLNFLLFAGGGMGRSGSSGSV